MKSNSYIVPLGGAAEVGANAHYLNLGDGGLLLDAGLHPKFRGTAALPAFDEVDGEVDAVVITHAHLDHVGALPLALRRFPRSRVLMTNPTALLAVRMMRNAVALSRHRGDREPLFGHDDVRWIEQVVQTVNCGQRLTLDLGPGLRPTITLFNAGHILGAAGVLVESGGRRVFYTGDTCSSSQFICPAATYPSGPLDLLVLDCTHGADPEPNAVEERGRFRQAVEQLAAFVVKVAERGGSTLIPLFAMGRAQEILGVLAQLMRTGRIPQLPIVLSGLAHAVSQIYDATRHEAIRHHNNLALESLDYQILRRKNINDPELLRQPCIIGATSGMVFAETAAHRLAGRMLPDPTCGVAVVGYLDPDSPGHTIAASEPGQWLDLGLSDGPVQRRCELQRFPFTAHSHAGQLLETVRRLDPRQVVLVHGDRAAVETMERRVARLGPPVTVAEIGQPVRF